MKRLILVLLTVGLYIAHQDFWFWRSMRPFVFGFLPVGLFYHLCYTVAVAVLMWILTRAAWPADIERDAESAGGPADHRGEGATR